MNKSLSTFSLIILLLVLSAPRLTAKHIPYTELKLLGRGWADTESYDKTLARVPSRLVGHFNDIAKTTIPCTAGMAFHFSTNSRGIGAVYTLDVNRVMNHQAATGTRGLDLYLYDKASGRWLFMATHKPTAGLDQTADFGNFGMKLDGSYHDFLLYLPLYDGVKDFSLTIDDTATLRPAADTEIERENRVLVYGTSIIQGGCASRAGMAGTSILSRRLGCEVVNLGFSSGALLELTAAEAMAEVQNVGVYVIDVVHNASAPLLYSNLYDFVSILARANPKASFVFVDGLSFGRHYGTWGCEPDNNRQRIEVERLRSDFPDRRFEIMPAATVYGDAEGEGTVDGVHQTDLGFFTWARALAPIVAELRDSGPGASTFAPGVAEALEVVGCYDLTGRPVARPGSGIYIEVLSDGSARKVYK